MLTEEEVTKLMEKGRENLTQEELSQIHFAIMNTPKMYETAINGALSSKNYVLFISLMSENSINHWYEKGKNNGEIH